MIRVRKIAHVTYETPDVERQTDYYTEVLGLSLIAKERGAVFLSSTLDHHSVVLRKGPDAKCLRIGFQLAPEDDLDAFDQQTAAIGIKVARKSARPHAPRVRPRNDNRQCRYCGACGGQGDASAEQCRGDALDH